LKKNLKSPIILAFIFAWLVMGCIDDTDFGTPNVNCEEPIIEANTTIYNLQEMYAFGGKTFEDELIVEGYVTSNDLSGNIYKTLFIQDQPENPTAAIKIAIDQNSLYTKYPVGNKIYVKLKGLSIDYYFGSLQIGKNYDDEFQGISRFEVSNHLIRSCEYATIIPKKVTINMLKKNDLGMIIELENVQFNKAESGKSFANIDNNQTVSRQIDQFDDDCNLTGSTFLRNSGYASFKNELLPTKKGNIIALFDSYYDDFQLLIRSIDGLNMEETGCNESSQLAITNTLKEVVNLYEGSMYRFGTSVNHTVEAYVISTDSYGSFKKSLIVQDAFENPSAGIQILLDSEEIHQFFKPGDKVLLKLNRLYMDEVDNVLSIGFGGNELNELTEEEIHNHIINTQENTEIIPVEIDITEVKFPEHQQVLVSIAALQLVKEEMGHPFTYDKGDEDAIRTFETCGNPSKLSLYTSGSALFANQEIPNGSGKITGILGNNLLEIRDLNDVTFNGNYEACPEIEQKILITEIADPENVTTARFVELFNASDFNIDLEGWKLNKYLNGSNSPSSGGLDLSGYSIPQNSFLIIANTGYQLLFENSPAIETSYMSGNGDDSFELVNSQGKTIDSYGEIGKDGTDLNWEYLDGKAIRRTSVTKPNPTFDVSEWVIYTDNNNSLTENPNSPQFAPTDFSPGIR